VSAGTNAVTCTAADSRGRSAICSFNVTVVQPPRLTLSRFLAFGDSLTEGAVNETNSQRLVDYPNSYPVKLEAALRAYFRGQSLIVMNDGVGGEAITVPSIHSPGATVRLPVSLDANRPEVLLLMEGTNDLVIDFVSTDDVQSEAVEGLRKMIETAQGRGVRVFLATIPPMSSSGAKHLDPEIVAAVPIYNNRVRNLAAAKGVPLVDVYEALKDHPELQAPDGQHLTILGYERVAQTFFEAIKANLGAPGAVR
jgi:lysophospholipase L1-like esterase